MKNKEKYAKEIVDIACDGSNIALSKDTAKPIKCNSIRCYKCAFRFSNGDECYTARRKWAESEYIEKLVISKRDRTFLECLDKRFEYIARDKNGELFIYKSEPYKSKIFNVWNSSDCSGLALRYNIEFPMIQWDDTEPWLIENLKKLKVVEEYE